MKKRKRKKKGRQAAGVLWAFDGDQARWDELAQGLSAAQLRLLDRNLQWACTQCAGAWSLLNGMVCVIAREQEHRAHREQKGEE